MTELKVWPLLSTCSKRAFLRQKKKWGHPYEYYPQQRLLNRLCFELNMTKEEVLDQMDTEQAFLLRHLRYFN